MKQFLPVFIGLFLFSSAFSQRDTSVSGTIAADYSRANEERLKLSIYPVPFRDGNFTIKSEKEISGLRITNIIGQVVYKSSFGVPVNEIKVTLPEAGRGIYIIIVSFSDNTKTVRRISSEGNSS